MPRLKKRKQYGKRGVSCPATDQEIREYFDRGGTVTLLPPGQFTLSLRTIIDLSPSKRGRASFAD